MEATDTNNFNVNGRNKSCVIVIEKDMVTNMQELEAPTGNFTKIVQRIPVKIVFDPASIQGYDSRITPGMSAEVSVEVK